MGILKRLIVIATLVMVATFGLATVATAHDGPHPYPYCGHADHYSNYAWGYGTYGAYTWEGYLGHGDYDNHMGGTTHWHLYETWKWSDYWWDWYFYDYEWKKC